MTKLRIVVGDDGWVQLRLRHPSINGGRLQRQAFKMPEDPAERRQVASVAVAKLRGERQGDAQGSAGKLGSV